MKESEKMIGEIYLELIWVEQGLLAAVWQCPVAPVGRNEILTSQKEMGQASSSGPQFQEGRISEKWNWQNKFELEIPS